ncbi:MAG: response regulator [Candidatus Omnitrophota bacterium]|nr:response regulator [Candidatus Omnitrophota bacterium]
MGKKTVLVIDDEAEFVDAVKMRLEANDYMVVEAYNGREGFEKARKQHPDLILLDLVMPQVNGFEALSQLKSDPRTMNIPVIVLTAKTEAEYALDAGRLGASDYMIKPASMEQLVSMVKRHVVSG